MASLDKLGILGIRSFSPRDDQVIQFFSPLTLILGPNGTGKTTIIECLRYISSGDMPPNSKTNCAFIHDPKMAKESEVKARIKLKFSDTRGKTVVTTRNISAVQKPKKIEMRTLEGNISRLADDGKTVSISSKCADLEREMVTCFGVSKAILNNVIFCHQEDSNWPLSEGKMLKVKFDEIFAATRYIKALDSIQKIRLTQDGAAKVYAAELTYLEDNKKQADQMKLDLEKLETRLAASKDLVRRIEEKLQPILNSLNEIVKKETTIGQVEIQLTKKETELNVEKKSCKDLAKSIVQMFNGSNDELRQELRSCTRRLDDQKAEREDVEETLLKIKKEAPHLSSKKSSLLLELGKLQTEMEQHKTRIDKRDRMAKILIDKLELNAFHHNEHFTDDQMKELLAQLKTAVDKKKADHDILKNKYLSEEKELQEKLDNKRDAKTKLQQTESFRNKQITDNQNEIRFINSKLVDAETSASRLHHIEADLKKKKEELENALNEFDVTLIRSEVGKLQDESSTLNGQIKKLEAEMMKLHSFAEARTELDVAKKDKAAKEELIRKLKAKHEDALKHCLGNMPASNIRSTMDHFVTQLNREMEQLRDKQGKLSTQLATCETERRRYVQDLKMKESELQECEESLFETCGNKDLEASILVAESLLKSMQEENGSLTGTQYIYNTFLNKLKLPDACCPLCHRGFSDSHDVDDLIEELTTKLRVFPDEVESKRRVLQNQQEKYNSMLILKPVKKKLEVLKVEIPALKLKIKNAGENIDKYNSEISEVDDLMLIKQTDKSLAANMHSDLVLMDQTISELSKVEQRILSVNKLLGDASCRSMNVVNQEKVDIQQKVDDIQNIIRNKQQQITSYLERTQSLQAEVNLLGAEQLEISRSVQQIAELKNRKDLLLNEITNFQKEIENIKAKLEPFEDEIFAVHQQKEAFSKTKEHALEESMHAVRELQLRINDLSTIHLEISRFLDNKKPEILQKRQKDLDDTEQQLKKLEDNKLVLSEKLRALSEEIDNHQTKVRNLKDNNEFRQKQEQIQILEQDVVDLKTRLGGFDIKTLQKRKTELFNEEDSCRAERHKAEGQQHELEENIRKLTKDLNLERFRDAEKQYKEKLIKLRTTTIASSDLIKYSTALDGAIMQYHSLKMKEINKIIKELWSATYRGNDIDYIAIRSDSDEGKQSTGSKRKVYHYRVVMIKGDIEYDMRGRCSAGQKVLASLIIRLALAETFCLNCGILALDEPTTNLDQDNIESLAEALASIVRSRANNGNRNFQLIIITHDEDFVERLGRSEFVDYYYRIGKNEKGHSTVTKYHVQSLP